MERSINILFITILLSGQIACTNKPASDQDGSADTLTVQTDSLATADSLVSDLPRFYLNEHQQKVFTNPEKVAVFPGGAEKMAAFIEGELVYPEASAGTGAEGTVVVSFIIDESGNVDNVEVVSPLDDPLLNTEARRAVRNMPRWTPAQEEGTPVKSRYLLPVSFSAGS